MSEQPSAAAGKPVRRTRLEMLLDLFELLTEAEKCEAAEKIGQRIEKFCEDRRRYYGGLLRQFCPDKKRRG